MFNLVQDPVFTTSFNKVAGDVSDMFYLLAGNAKTGDCIVSGTRRQSIAYYEDAHFTYGTIEQNGVDPNFVTANNEYYWTIPNDYTLISTDVSYLANTLEGCTYNDENPAPPPTEITTLTVQYPMRMYPALEGAVSGSAGPAVQVYTEKYWPDTEFNLAETLSGGQVQLPTDEMFNDYFGAWVAAPMDDYTRMGNSARIFVTAAQPDDRTLEHGLLNAIYSPRDATTYRMAIAEWATETDIDTGEELPPAWKTNYTPMIVLKSYFTGEPEGQFIDGCKGTPIAVWPFCYNVGKIEDADKKGFRFSNNSANGSNLQSEGDYHANIGTGSVKNIYSQAHYNASEIYYLAGYEIKKKSGIYFGVGGPYLAMLEVLAFGHQAGKRKTIAEQSTDDSREVVLFQMECGWRISYMPYSGREQSLYLVGGAEPELLEERYWVGSTAINEKDGKVILVVERANFGVTNNTRIFVWDVSGGTPVLQDAPEQTITLASINMAIPQLLADVPASL